MAKLTLTCLLLMGVWPLLLESQWTNKQARWNRSKRQAPIGILNPPIPTSIAHFLGSSQAPIDNCPRDQVKMPNGHCYRLLTQGPCTINQYILLDPSKHKPYCAERLCAPDRTFLFSDQLCHDRRDARLCPPGRQLYETSYGTPICQCPQGTYEGDDDLDDDVCEPLLGRALACPPGQVFWFRDFSLPPECLPDPCGGDNLNRGPNDLPFVPFSDGRCFQLGSMPNVCPAQTWYIIAMEKLRGVCRSLEDAGYQVFDEQTLARLNEIYGPPIARERTSPIAVPSTGSTGGQAVGAGGSGIAGAATPTGVAGSTPSSGTFGIAAGPSGQGISTGGSGIGGQGTLSQGVGNQGTFSGGAGGSNQGTVGGVVGSGNQGILSTGGQGGFSGGSGIGVLGGFGTSGQGGFSGGSGTGVQGGFTGGSNTGQGGFSGGSGNSGLGGFSGAPSVGGQGGFSGVPSTGGQGGFSGVSSAGGQGGFSGVPSASGQGGFSGVPIAGGQGGFSGVPIAGGQGGFSGVPIAGGQGGFSGVPISGGQGGFSGGFGAGFSARPANPLTGGGGFSISQGQHPNTYIDDQSREVFGLYDDEELLFRTDGQSQVESVVGDVGDLTINEGRLLADIDVLPSGDPVELLQAPPGHELHGFFNSVRTLVKHGPHNRSRRSPLPHASPGNVFETGLVACRAGARRDINAKCRDTVLPASAPASRPARAAPPVPSRPGCPNGQAFDISRMCVPAGSAVDSINAFNLG